MQLEYFGTSNDSAGHYFWQVNYESISRSMRNFNNCPFNPEALPYVKRGEVRKSGYAKFYLFAGFSICAIDGSCYDKGPQGKTIFFIEEEMPDEDLKHIILSMPIAKRILEKIPFTVNW